jgi:hypothetical protein
MSISGMRGEGARSPGRRSRRFLRSKRTWGALIGAATLLSIAIPAASFADSASGCDFAANGTTESCTGPLSGSTFAGGDGNLLASPTTFGSTDWQNVAGLNKGIDLASGAGDNSFGQGTKEDNSNVTVVTGSIPPQKSDLTRFYEASEFAHNSNFLYLAWERTNNLGSANMDFEINQKTQPDLTTTGPKTLNRTAGDLLVTFDFTNGGGRPTLSLLRWLTSASVPALPGFATNTCLSANSFPCWGDQITLNSSNSLGAVNNLDAVTDPFVSNTANNIGVNRFGETAINLTAAGVFPPGTCEAFGSAFLKSRSSASFPAEVKDFVAPVPVNISNCGGVTIIKHTDPRGINQDFSYTSTIPDPGSSSATDCTANSADPTPSSFTLNDNGNTTGDNTANTENCVVAAGSYNVTEGAEPANFKLESLTCTDNGVAGSSGSQDGTDPFKADITVTPGGHVTCTYVNQRQLGAIKITKTGKDKNCTSASDTISNGVCTGAGTADLSGAVFSIKDSTGNVSGSPATTGSDGTVCVDHLPFGTYSVQETSAPNGYAIDDTTAHNVSVSTNSTCGDGNEATFSASDTPLTDISANASSEVKGATNSTITCIDSGNGDVGNSPQGPGDPVTVTANGLKPGTYTCTIVIDP